MIEAVILTCMVAMALGVVLLGAGTMIDGVGYLIDLKRRKGDNEEAQE